MEKSSENYEDRKDRHFVLSITAALVGFGILAIIFFEISSCNSCCWRSLGAAGVLAGSSFALGALLGLLFGIPRGPSQDDNSQSPKGLSTNTNLIQISDWLTKALVGVSLTQLYKIPAGLMRVSDFFRKDIGSGPVAVAILIHFMTSGFLSGYLLTRVILQQAFHRADRIPDVTQAGITSDSCEPVADDPNPPGKRNVEAKVGGS